MHTYRLKLFVAGKTPRSARAIELLERICRDDLGGRGELEVIDTLEDPKAAEEQGVLATPTLVKESPRPVQWVIGDLSERKKVLARLGIEFDGGDDPTASEAGDARGAAE